MNRELSDKARKILFYIVIAISFVAVLFYTCVTPIMSDDLPFIANPYQSLGEILKACYEEYMDVNARQVTHFIMRCFLSGPKWLFNICNAAAFVTVMLLMYWNVDGRKKYDFTLLGLINLLVWHYGVSFDQTVLWEGGSCNYLWGALIFLSFITCYRYALKKQDTIKQGNLLAIGLFVLGVLSGWCNENSSGGCLLIILAYFGLAYYEKRKIKPWMISGILGNMVGLGFLVLAPGNANRMDLMQEEHTGIMALVSRFLKINNVVYEYFLVMIIITVVIVVYLWLKGNAWESFQTIGVFMLAGFATSYVLILTPQPMDRAHFGAGLFITIACVQAVALIPKEELHLNVLKYGGTLAFAVFMYFVYFENGADLTRIYRETIERENYILEQKEAGNYDLVVPMIRPEFQTKYSFIYLNDVEEDPNTWGSVIYRDYYGLNSLRGVPRDEWTEY